jgi:hypothetical protein
LSGGFCAEDLRRCLDPLARPNKTLKRSTPALIPFGSPLVLSRVHRVEPKRMAEIT